VIPGLVAQLRGDLLPFEDGVGVQFQHLLQHKAQPLPVDGRIRPVASLVVCPLVIGQAQAVPHLGIVLFLIQAVRESFQQNGHAQEGAGDLN